MCSATQNDILAGHMHMLIDKETLMTFLYNV